MRQLELNLTPRSEHRASVDPWRYRFTDNALIEEWGGRRIVYGLWEKLFGCWIVDINNYRSREIVPTWRPLNRNGVWRDQAEIRRFGGAPPPKALASKWRYEANAAFAGYFTGIPHRLRAVVAPLDHHQWLGLDLAWQEPRFADFLDAEFFNGTEQYVYACFELAKAANLNRARRRHFVETLLHCKRTEFMAEITGHPCSRTTLRVINKLGGEPLSAELYRTVIACMNDTRAAKALCHAECIDPDTIQVLSHLPSEFLVPGVVRILLEDPALATCWLEDGYTGMLGVTRHLQELLSSAPDAWRSRIMTALRGVSDVEELGNWAARWQDRLTEFLRFPPPPFPTQGRLAPIATAAEMRSEARRMRNCLRRKIASVIDNRAYFFHWDGEEQATVLIENESGRGWRFTEALGRDNTRLSPQTVAYICALVERALNRRHQGEFRANRSPADR